MRTKNAISSATYNMLFGYLSNIVRIEDERFESILKDAVIGLWCDKREEILQIQGHTSKKLWFINKGIVYLYYIDTVKSEQIAFMFFCTGELVIIPDNFRIGDLSSCYAIVCKETELLELTIADLDHLQYIFPKVTELKKGILSKISKKESERNYILSLEPIPRIKTFMTQYPELHPANRTIKIMDRTIASFLELDTAYFNRLKRKLLQKK